MTRPRPRLLVSVRDPGEARAAVTGGADLIDIKEPAHGPLGMADPGTIRRIVHAVNGARPVSVALGELHQFSAVRLPGGVRYAKLGLAAAPSDWREQLVSAFQVVQGVQPIAGSYADHHRVDAPSVDDVLDWAIQNQAAGLLIDTAIKDGRTLFDWLSDDQLSRIVGRAHGAGLLIALAGSLRVDLLPRCCRLATDVIAVRGAACLEGERTSGISPDRIRDLVESIASHSASAGHCEDRPAGRALAL